ncbi:hypothetical protein OU798_18985 [Prolixibacteraceae bacterium Z1-6]|uniref:Uncharacterized protein n=1 Tax=Draconibacterium aestuarii TaxID=2998507 RepID=A0A9X3J7X2_9BACT|nr:hypothetical protein [Prolixibacteraceae bacterium Z1-6]
MKTKTWVLTALAFFIVAIGFATDFPKMNVVPIEADKAMIAYKSVESTPLEITLINCDGEILYYQKTKERYNEYQKILDFSQLGDGDYCVCVNFGNRSISRTVNVNHETIKVGAAQHLFEPYFCMKEGMLDVSFFNCSQKQVYLNIYKNGKYVNGLKLGKDLTIQKRLDLRNLKYGEYEIVLTDVFKDHKYIAQL